MLNELETVLVSWIAQWTQADACAIATTFSARRGRKNLPIPLCLLRRDDLAIVVHRP